MIMKKTLKVVLVAALAVVAVNANAQFGINVGYVNSVERAKIGGEKDSNDAMNGFKVGATYDIGLIAGLSIRPGLNYTYISDKLADQDLLGVNMKLTRAEHFLNIPIDVKYAYGFSDNFKIYAFAGPKISLGLVSNLTAKAKGSVLGQEIDAKGAYNFYTGKVKVNGADGTVEDEIDDILDDNGRFNRFDVQLGVGVGVQVLKLLSVEFGYDWGLLNRVKDMPDNSWYKRNQMYVSVGLNF